MVGEPSIEYRASVGPFMTFALAGTAWTARPRSFLLALGLVAWSAAFLGACQPQSSRHGDAGQPEAAVGDAALEPQTDDAAEPLQPPPSALDAGKDAGTPA